MRAKFAQVGAKVSAGVCEKHQGETIRRGVFETHRAVTLSQHLHLNSKPGHLRSANIDRCVY